MIFLVLTLVIPSLCVDDPPIPRFRRSFSVIGLDNSNVDLLNVQRAVREASELRRGPAVIELRGVFDFGNCSFCVKIPSHFTIRGFGDPTSEHGDATVTLIKASGVAPFVVDDQDRSSVTVLEQLWIQGAQTLAVLYRRVTGHVIMRRMRITGVRPAVGFRFGIAGVGVGGVPSMGEDASVPKSTGSVTFENNHIDHDVTWTGPGDDNGIAFAMCELAFVNISGNFIRAGEAVEIEGCKGKRSSYLVSRNTIVQTTAKSSLVNATTYLAFPQLAGGHPAAIKIIGNEALYTLVEDNRVDLSLADTGAVCVMTGTVENSDASIRVSGNSCIMNGQFSALLGGWAGTPGFFPASWIDHLVFSSNILHGHAFFGAAFMNFTYSVAGVVLPSQTSVSRSRSNFIFGNNWSKFKSEVADLFFDVSTVSNSAWGTFSGQVIDLGTQNHIMNEKIA